MTVRFEYVRFSDGSAMQQPHEEEVPENWNAVVIDSFSGIAKTYSLATNEEPLARISNEAVDDLVAKLVKERDLTELLEVGTGDGTRLVNIRRKAGRTHDIRLRGTELSDEMILEARRKGIDIVKHDMRESLPFKTSSLDVVLYLNNDFGYVMHPSRGESMRVAALKSAYATLKPGGVLLLDLLSQDNENQDRNGRVAYYERRLVVDGKPQQETFRFWAKEFRFREIERLLAAAGIPTRTTRVQYMVRYDLKSDGQMDMSRSGKIVQECVGFEGLDIGRIVKDYRAGTAYKMIVTVEKPK